MAKRKKKAKSPLKKGDLLAFLNNRRVVLQKINELFLCMQDLLDKYESLLSETENPNNKESPQQKDYEENLNNLREAYEDLFEEICNSSFGEILVTEHALLRFIQRAYGVNIERLSQEIASDIAHYVGTLGSGKFPLSRGGRAIVQNGVVVTVVE